MAAIMNERSCFTFTKDNAYLRALTQRNSFGKRKRLENFGLRASVASKEWCLKKRSKKYKVKPVCMLNHGVW